MSSLLSTRFLFKQQAKIASTTDDVLIDRLLAEVSETIERICDRTFGTATYRTWLDGSGERCMLLPNYPITNIYMVTEYTDDVMTLSFSGGEEASVSATSTAVLLHSVSTTGAETSTTCLLATYKTVTALATYINTLSGWTATITSSMDTRPTALLKPMWSEDAASPNQATLTIASDSSKIRVSSLTQRSIERDHGFVFPRGRNNLFVWYVAGYTLPVDNTGHIALTTEGDMPAGLMYVVNSIINEMYQSVTANQTINSERIGGYSYSRADVTQITQARVAGLFPYIRRTV